MRLAVIIPSYARPQILGRLLQHLEYQNRLPDIVVVSVSDKEHASPYQPSGFRPSIIVGPKGLCAQRNRALEAVLSTADIVTFFDDDFLPANNYIERLVEKFAMWPDIAAIMGDVVVDGARGMGLTFDEGLMVLRALETCLYSDHAPIDQVGTYGCNMSIRTTAIGGTRFDERLALYGWQEDIDFTSRLRRRSRVVLFPDLVGVHLGFKAGRVSGVRFGYSQVVNPTYLIRKGTLPTGFGLRLMARNVAANLARSVWPERHVDRRGRLRGNLIGALHIARGRIEPEHILQI